MSKRVPAGGGSTSSRPPGRDSIGQPVKAAELYKILRGELDSWFKERGFKRHRSCGLAYQRPHDTRFLMVWFQCDKYVGTSYRLGGRAPDFTLMLDVGEPGEAAREVLAFVSPFPDLTLVPGRVLKMGGGRPPVYELERAAPGIWKVRLGRAQLDFSREPDNLLRRLGVGWPLAAYWAQVRALFHLAPMKRELLAVWTC